MVLSSMQCSNLDFKKRHHRRRVMLKPLVDLIMKRSMLAGKHALLQEFLPAGRKTYCAFQICKFLSARLKQHIQMGFFLKLEEEGL
ncbi:hypothetical protein SLEP1_g47537 [Rubroshorea leprosula]|uniref:Uncharacterized protein n=1 Tax=Rubroshorea leprosula TaxID=152421 RepID=A0AAV5LT04_9ROSI|nr:hypothetical protein SLEP1_g47537 [Rubroshorea leprosula]